MKSGALIVGVIVVVLLVWLVPSAWKFSGDVANMKTALQSTTEYYRTAGEAHAAALADATGGAEPDMSSSQKILVAFSAVGRASSVPDQLQSVAALEKQLGDFFAPEMEHAAGLLTNQHFIALNQEITGHGGSSTLVFEYNKAAAVVREDMQSFPGSVWGALMVGSEPPTLTLDGKTRPVKVML